ncbi:MAG TPA: ATP-binding protein [Gemmatimonadales bacterium]|nr:ATP-binding protein [Gemmatimonadales bacterium]
MALENFLTAGRRTSTIDVRISYKIIELFSEGLYSSPHKAIEELVSNAFDAGAEHVHVILPVDLQASDGTIVVIDDGEGMDAAGFRHHWLIGTSLKRDAKYKPPKGRKQIGKFGIGKLATFVLANRLTHISKRGGRYFAATMDYTLVPAGDGNGVTAKKSVKLPLRELTESQARAAVDPWTSGSKSGYKALKLFGRGAANSWTVAVLSSLKGMASEIQRGRLHWVLASGMPLRDDFELYLDGTRVLPSKIKQKRIGRWVLGKDLVELPAPASEDGEVSEDTDQTATAPKRFGLTFPGLGRITGYVELFEDPIDVGKSAEIERSNGFFVYVRDRLINIDDPGFGIDRNKLRHGTFSRFRMVLYADGLDNELRSSREALRAGPLFNIARNVAHAGFNHARAKHDEDEKAGAAGSQVARRVAASPATLTRRPMATLVAAAFKGKYRPRYVTVPLGLGEREQQEFLQALQGETEDAPSLVQASELVDTLSQDQPLAVFDARTGRLQINNLHPFVAHFLDDYEDRTRSVPLELLAMSEVLLEAHLLQLGIAEAQVHDSLSQRDLLLRQLARSTGRRNARLVAQALEDAASDQAKLESELVSCFDSMGFEAIPLGGSGKPDGRAEAWLSAGTDGGRRSYAVTLEAKSKQAPGGKVAAKTVSVSTIARHRQDYGCDHAIVVGPDFPTTKGADAALAKEIEDNRKNNPGKTITLIRIHDLARLVRLVPLRRIGLHRIRDLLLQCSLPDDAATWINAIAAEKRQQAPYKDILEVIHEEQRAQDLERVEFGALRAGLRRSRKVELSSVELIDACKALERWVPEWVTVQEQSVAIHMRPDKILAAVSSAIGEYPESERQQSDLPAK